MCMPLLYAFMPSHSFLAAFENMYKGWFERWRFVWMPFCYRQSQENPEWAPGRVKFAKTLAEAGGSNLFGHWVICAWELLREQEEEKRAQGTPGWVTTMFALISLNILAPLNYKTDPWLYWWQYSPLRWWQLLYIFTTCFQEEKTGALIPLNRKATNIELIELYSHVGIVQRWIITA